VKVSIQKIAQQHGSQIFEPNQKAILQIISKGRALVTIDYPNQPSLTAEVSTGTYFFTPANFPAFNYAWELTDNNPVELVNVELDDQDISSEYQAVDFNHDLLIYEVLKQLAKEDEDCTSELFTSLKKTLLLYMASLHDQQLLRKNALDEARRLERLTEHIHENIQKNIDLSSMARIYGASKYYFIKKFKAYKGITPVRFLKATRLEKAMELLVETDWSISEIAFKVGFDLPNSFSRDFRKHTSMSPSAYRMLKKRKDNN